MQITKLLNGLAEAKNKPGGKDGLVIMERLQDGLSPHTKTLLVSGMLACMLVYDTTYVCI